MEFLLLGAVMMGGLSAFIASHKNRDPIGWFIAGALFSILAVIAIAAIPALPAKAEKYDWTKAP